MLRLFLLRVVETYFRHRFLWLLPIVIMMGFAGVKWVTTKPTYISVSAMYVNKETLLASMTEIMQSGFSWVTPAQATVDEFKELLQTDAFVRSVIELTDLEKEMSSDPITVATVIADARSAIWVGTLGNNTITVGSINRDPAIAQQLASGTINTYVQWKINTGRDQTVTAQDFFASLVENYQKDVTTAQGKIKDYLDSHPMPLSGDRPASELVEIEQLNSELSTAVDRYKKALENLESSQLSLAVNESKVRQTYLLLDGPRFPLKPSQTTKSALITSVIFVFVGVFLSLAGIVVAALFDRSLRFPQDVRQTVELPVFTQLPGQVQAAKPQKAKKKK